MISKVLKSGRLSKAEYERRLPPLRDELLAAQSEAREADKFAIAVIVTGVPAAGRSETVNELLEWLDPKHVTVTAFGEPDREEKSRPPMYRYWRTLPARGRIAFFFSGWYSDYMDRAHHHPDKVRKHEKRQVERIRRLEAMLVADGVRVVKIYLHTDAKTQKRRIERLRADKLTRWRVTQEDRWLARHYNIVKRVNERCLKLTDHRAAHWHVVDGTDEQFRLIAVGQILRDELLAGVRQSARKAKSAPPAAKATQSTTRGAAKHASVRAKKLPEMQKDSYQRELQVLQRRLALLARRARFQKHALVLAFEGMDAAGKGGAIRRVTQALDARQYQVVPVSAPTPQELSYPYLWRFWQHVPRHGQVAIFDRSWYGRVLVERVRGFAAPADWQRAYEEISEFELELNEHSIIVAKFWLQVSLAEQLRRFDARESDRLKRFKVDKEDWINRDFYADYQAAAVEMIERTDAQAAPWTVIAADDKEAARLEVLKTVCEEIEKRLG